MNAPRLLASLVVIIVPLSALADASGATQLVERGLNAYLEAGPDAALKIWLEGSGLEGNTQALTQANSLRQIEDYYGKPEGFDIVMEHAITPRSRMVVFAVNYAKGVMYCRFQTYLLKTNAWVLTEFKFNTEAAAILPSNIVYGN